MDEQGTVAARFEAIGLPAEVSSVVANAFVEAPNKRLVWNDFVELLASLGVLGDAVDLYEFERRVRILISTKEAPVSSENDTADGMRPRAIDLGEFETIFKFYFKKACTALLMQMTSIVGSKTIAHKQLRRPHLLAPDFVFGMRMGFAFGHAHRTWPSKWQTCVVRSVVGGQLQGPLLSCEYRAESFGKRMHFFDLRQARAGEDRSHSPRRADTPSFSVDEVYTRFAKKYKLVQHTRGADSEPERNLATVRRTLMAIGSPSLSMFAGHASFDVTGKSAAKLLYSAVGDFSSGNFRILNSWKQVVAKSVSDCEASDGSVYSVVQVEAGHDLLAMTVLALLGALSPEVVVEPTPEMVATAAETAPRISSPYVDIKSSLEGVDLFGTRKMHSVRAPAPVQ